jgi:hypothetical protein
MFEFLDEWQGAPFRARRRGEPASVRLQAAARKK